MATKEIPAVPTPPTLEQKRDYAHIASAAVRYLRSHIDEHPDFLERVEEINGSEDPSYLLGKTVVHTAVEATAAELRIVRANLETQAAAQHAN